MGKKVPFAYDVLTIRVEPVGPALYHVVCEGEINVSTSPQFKEALNRQIDVKRECSLIIDLEKVRYVDSTGFVAMVSALKRVREHEGAIVLVCTNPHILKIFNVTGLNNVFEIYQTVDQAKRPFEG